MSENNQNNYSGIIALAVAFLSLLLAVAGLMLPEASELSIANLNGTKINFPINGQALIYNASLTSWQNTNFTKIQSGYSPTFNTSDVGQINATFAFAESFDVNPIVVVSLNEISNSSVTISNIQALNITTIGFDASINISTPGNGTVLISYIAVG